MNKFLTRNTITSRNPDDLAIIAVEEQADNPDEFLLLIGFYLLCLWLCHQLKEAS
jgi:hypothetical protein